jgi:predicted HD phosphohydrolase
MQAGLVTADSVSQELARYDAAGSATVSAFIRQHADAALAIAQLETIYREALAEPVDWSAAAGRQACEAASAYLTSLVPMLKDRTGQVGAGVRQERQLAALSQQAARLAAIEARAFAAEQALHATREELAAVRASTTWALFAPYRRLRARVRRLRATRLVL